MTLGLTIKILLAIVALGVGIWLGMPGRYTQTVDEIEEAMERGGGRRRTVKKVFTPLAWMQRNASAKGSSRRRTRGGFNLESPDDR